jgi:protein ImuB
LVPPASQSPTTNHRPRTTNDQPPTATLRQWGLRTLGEFAALPAHEVAARLGPAGVEWQRVARGEDRGPLVAVVPEERFEETLELEWPIEGLEPLSFVLGRLMEPLSAHLERRDRGAAVLYVRLQLVTRAVHERSLQLPVPMRDARALRTLALLDLESHPPDAAVDRITVAVDPTPGRVVQFSLLTRPLPSPEHLSTLAARLTALMGEGRCGSPELVDSWRPGAFAMKPFAPRESTVMHSQHHTPIQPPLPSAPVPKAQTHSGLPVNEAANPVVALRRFRTPIPARVRAEDGRPVHVSTTCGLGGGRVTTAAGPWRTSGAWWEEPLGAPTGEDGPVPPKPRSGASGPVPPKPRSGEGGWDRDEWDVALADGVTYRLFRQRDDDRWAIEGVVD